LLLIFRNGFSVKGTACWERLDGDTGCNSVVELVKINITLNGTGQLIGEVNFTTNLEDLWFSLVEWKVVTVEDNLHNKGIHGVLMWVVDLSSNRQATVLQVA